MHSFALSKFQLSIVARTALELPPTRSAPGDFFGEQFFRFLVERMMGDGDPRPALRETHRSRLLAAQPSIPLLEK